MERVLLVSLKVNLLWKKTSKLLSMRHVNAVFVLLISISET